MDSWITVKTADGPMRSYVARPSGRGGPHPGVVVFQEAFGVNAYVKSVCDRLADAGYTALAPELFHRTGTHVEIEYGDRPKVLAALAGLTNAQIEEDGGAAVAALRAMPEVDPERVGVVGFCMGGFAATLTGLTTAVGAVVAFYPGMLVVPREGLKLTPLVEQIPKLAAATQIHYGSLDQGISAEHRDAVKRALAASQCEHQVLVHEGADHGFHSHDRGPTYHPQAAEEAWHETLTWLKDSLR